ncbi:MAG: cytochrome c [Rubrivivax sp.]|nr:cytochrome c [Rubrivivax sp.]
MKHKILATLLCATAGLSALPAAAQFQKPEDAIRYRQAAMTLMAAHFGRIAAMAQGKAPWDAQAAAANMLVVNTVHKLPFAAFGPGTDKGAKTRALPEVWSKTADFKDHADKLDEAIGPLDAAVKTGSLDNVKTAVGPVGKACKGCHDDFQSK